MRQKQKGLTLIETMMIVAAIGILTTIAIPPAYQAYENFRAEEQVSEAVSLLDSVKPAVSAFHAEHKRWPEKTEFDGLIGPQTGKYVQNLTPRVVPGGFQVTATFKSSGTSPALLENGTGRTLVLATTDGSKWVCNDDANPATGVPGLVAGTVSKEHRPAACK